MLIEFGERCLGCRSRLPIPPWNNGIQTTASPQDVDAALSLLSTSERPLIVAGGGINHTRGTAEILEFAELLDAPIVMTGFGKGSVPEDSPYSIGVFRDGVSQVAMEASDLIVAVGTRFNYRDTGNWSLKIPQPLCCISKPIQRKFTRNILRLSASVRIRNWFCVN